MVKVFCVVLFMFGLVSCKKNESSNNDNEVPKALYGTWILTDTGEAVPSIIDGKETTISYRTHLKLEPSKATYIVYCESPDLGTASSVGVTTATMTNETIVIGNPSMMPTAAWCDADYGALDKPANYSLINDALHITFDAAQGKLVLHRAR